MGQIDLKQNQGAKPVDTPAGLSDATAYAIHGMNAIDRANDRLAAGIKHVSDALFNVSKDMAETRNRVEADSAQIEIFKLEDADNKKIEADIVNGKIKTPEQFQETYNKLYASRETKIDKYLEDNVCSGRNAEFLKLEAKKKSTANFAHMSGVYIRYENERIWKTTQGLIKQGVDSGNYDIGKKAISDYCVGKSKELMAQMNEKYDYDFCSERMNQAKTAIKGATTPEAIDEIISQLQSDGYDIGVYEKDRSEFNVFAGVYKDRLAHAQNSSKQKAKSEGKAIAQEKTDAVKSDISNNMRMASEMGTLINKNYIDGARESLKEVYDLYELSPEKKKKLISDFDNFCRDEQIKVQEQVNRNMYAQAEGALKNAVENNDGKFDLNVLSGGNEKNANNIANARKRVSEFIRIEGLVEKYKLGKLSKDEERQYALYRADYFEQLTSILNYDKDLDPRGEKLARICVGIDKYDAASRKELLGAIYSKVVKNTNLPANWSAADIKQFDASFADLCEFNRSLWFTFGKNDDNDPILYTKMRNRVLNLAQLRNMSTVEAIEELRKDPFAKNIILKKSREKALEFTNL